jgi:EAL domain-containing protein (putative c-di-GMP-specific phosphodiesterase class I)
VPDLVRQVLAESGLPAAQLEVEITESALARDLQQVMRALEQLRRMGVSVAIDDFGTGYSSLAYLRRLPVDEIKIDRQFIMNLGQDRSDDSLVAAILAMANSLGYTSIAEGGETDLQLQRLSQLGCEHAQGFAFATPVPAAELPAMVERLGLAAAPRLRVVRDLA